MKLYQEREGVDSNLIDVISKEQTREVYFVA